MGESTASNSGGRSPALALTQERKKQHGDWADQAGVAGRLKLDAHAGANWEAMTHSQREAIDMILTKVSRIVSGDAAHEDHWDDIGGYALLGKQGHD